jgi:hypothetical protein
MHFITLIAGAAENLLVPLSPRDLPGVDFTNHPFGRKIYGQFFMLEVWAKSHPRPTNSNFIFYKTFSGCQRGARTLFGAT